MFERAGKYLNSARGWVWVISLMPTVATFVVGVFEGLPWSQRILLGIATLASGAVLAYHALGAYERAAGWFGTRREGERIARELEELINVGHTHLKIGEVARMWSGDGATEYRQNVCLRRVKQGAHQGMIGLERSTKDGPTKDSTVHLRDCVTFFRERKWRTLPPIPPEQYARPEPTTRAPRQSSRPAWFARMPRRNWVTNWRDPP